MRKKKTRLSLQPNEHSVGISKRDQILQATLELIWEQGVHATPMSLIANRAQVAAGTIYHHFSSKEELLSELYLDTRRQIANALSPLNATDDYYSLFIEMWDGLFDYFITHPLRYNFAQATIQSPIIPKAVKRKAHSFWVKNIYFFQRGMDEGILRPMNLVLLTEHVYHSVSTSAGLQIRRTLEITPEIRAQAQAITWNSFKK